MGEFDTHRRGGLQAVIVGSLKRRPVVTLALYALVLALLALTVFAAILFARAVWSVFGDWGGFDGLQVADPLTTNALAAVSAASALITAVAVFA